MKYWDKKEEMKDKAIQHTTEMIQKYQKEIEASIEDTHYYYENSFANILSISDQEQPQVYLWQMDSVSALLKSKEISEGKTAVLNFASFKNPGGCFMTGSTAQEESLCHESFLYNVLEAFEDSYYKINRQKQGNAGCLYADRALYSPNVRFIREKDSIIADVITCAAPNWGAAERFGVSAQANATALEERISFIAKIIMDNNIDTIVLGAFGCGVFRQNASEVARLFRTYIKGVRNVIYAIPDDYNYDKFRMAFNAMRVLILGFDNYEELDNKMEELIAESENYLFSVAAGGLSGQTLEESLSAKWAKNNGAPLYWITANTGEELVKKMIKECDYLVMKVSSLSPQWHKNLLMQFKKAGKHGSVVK